MLKAKRKEAGLSRSKLMELTGVPVRTIQNWETSGIEHATVGAAIKVARVLGCSIEDLLSRD